MSLFIHLATLLVVSSFIGIGAGALALAYWHSRETPRDSHSGQGDLVDAGAFAWPEEAGLSGSSSMDSYWMDYDPPEHLKAIEQGEPYGDQAA